VANPDPEVRSSRLVTGAARKLPLGLSSGSGFVADLLIDFSYQV
jgi:hypothetical protein